MKRDYPDKNTQNAITRQHNAAAAQPSLELPAPDETFCRLVVAGKLSRAEAYREAYQSGATPNSMAVSACKRMHRIDIAARLRYLRDLQRVDPATSDAIRRAGGYRARLWEAVTSGTSAEAIAAIRVIRDIEREDAERKIKQGVTDPALVVGHLAKLVGKLPAMPGIERKAYVSGLIKGVVALGIGVNEIDQACAELCKAPTVNEI
jgi:hypothetical protein